MMYGVQNGQYYLAADGGTYGHYVIDCEKYAYCFDVVTVPFDSDGFSKGTQRIDAFKLAVCKYMLADGRPEWLPGAE